MLDARFQNLNSELVSLFQSVGILFRKETNCVFVTRTCLQEALSYLEFITIVKTHLSVLYLTASIWQYRTCISLKLALLRVSLIVCFFLFLFFFFYLIYISGKNTLYSKHL